MPHFSTRRTSRPPPPGQIGTESCLRDGSVAHRRWHTWRRTGGTHQSRMECLNIGRIVEFPSLHPSSATCRTQFVGVNDRFNMDCGQETRGNNQYGSIGRGDEVHVIPDGFNATSICAGAPSKICAGNRSGQTYTTIKWQSPDEGK